MSGRDIAAAYRGRWRFKPPRKCREMHAAGLFDANSSRCLQLVTFEVYGADTIAEGDVFVSDELVAGLIPIGGDSSGDRWCFDSRLRIEGQTAVAMCPHDGGGATYVAPSFAAFVYRLVLENLVDHEAFASSGVDRAGLRKLTLEHLKRLEPWLLKRWARQGREMVEGEWPTHKTFDDVMRRDPAFARLPEGEFEHLRG